MKIFLQGTKEGKKWALVEWEELSKPKLRGDIHLKYPNSLNKVLSEKIKWRWIKGHIDQWGHLWREKYDANIPENQLIHLEEEKVGSRIWNVAWLNHSLLRNQNL